MAFTQPWTPKGSTRPESFANRRVATSPDGVDTTTSLTEILALTPAAGSGLSRLTKVTVAVEDQDHFVQVEVDGQVVAFSKVPAGTTYIDWFPVGETTSFTADGSKKFAVKVQTVTGAGAAWAVILAQ